MSKDVLRTRFKAALILFLAWVVTLTVLAWKSGAPPPRERGVGVGLGSPADHHLAARGLPQAESPRRSDGSASMYS